MQVKYPLLLYILAAATGLLLSDVLQLTFEREQIHLASIVSLILLFLGFAIKPLRKPTLLIAFALYFFFQGKPLQNDSHYANQAQANSWHAVEFELQSAINPTPKYKRYWAKVQRIDSLHSYGLVQIYVAAEDTLIPGHRYFSLAQFRTLPKPYSPLHFDFEQYRNRQGIYGSFYLSSATITSQGQSNWILASTYWLRKKLMHGLDQRGLSPDNAHLLAALLWGERSALSEEIQENYRLTGAVHILSVSGLHVSIMAGFTYFFTKRTLRNRWAKWLFASGFILLFAAIAGFTPTVNRAALQFCCISIAPLLGRHPNGLALVWLSLLGLLFANPNYIWDIGFQLSYAAVIGIIVIYPWWRKRFRSSNKLLQFCSEIIGVSLIAQLFTLPLSLYYFHQFPGLFLLTNLLLLPWVSVVMFLGLGCCLLNSVGLAPSWSIQLLNWSIELQNGVIEKIAAVKGWYWSELYFREKELFCLALLLIGLIYAKEYSVKWRQQMLFSLGVLMLWIAPWNAIPHGIYIAPTLGRSELYQLQANEYRLYSSRPEKNEFRDYGFKTVYPQLQLADSLAHQLLLDRGKLLRADQKASSTFQATDWLWLSHNSTIPLANYLEQYSPKMIIMDGSSRVALREKWKATCRQKNIPFHDTSEKGYYQLK